MQDYERHVIKYMLALAGDLGWQASVYDGMSWTVKRSSDMDEVFQALCTTDGDRVSFFDPSQPEHLQSKGSVWLVYGNGPGEVISDYHVRLPMAEFMDKVNAFADEVEWDYRPSKR